jgi:hypothetical protein
MREHFDGLYIRTVRGREGIVPVLRIEIMDESGASLDFGETAMFSNIELKHDKTAMVFTFQDSNTIRCRGNGTCKLTMNPARYYSYANEYPGGRVEITYGNNFKLMATPVRGSIVLDAPFDRVCCTKIDITILPDKDGIIDFSIEEFQSAYIPKTFHPIEDCINSISSDIEKWLDKTVTTEFKYAKTRNLCSFVNYMSVVEPSGLIRRPSMYMSKNWMTNIWCWDRCFNVIALAKKNVEFAMEQYLSLFDHQNESGCLPDCVNDRYLIMDYVKPPLEGWALIHMMKHTEYLTDERLTLLYEPLKKWTDWWFSCRDYDHDGLPQYNSGLDSGWDNNSVFAGGNLVESPDLIAFLILQLDMLAIMASRLKMSDEAFYWKDRSVQTLEKFISHSWRVDRFIPYRSGTHTYNPDSDSLINYVPMILGKRLPLDIRTKLIEGLKKEDRFICPYGLTTEGMQSIYFDPKGYWSGPVWGPATTIIVYGLIECGETELAMEISRRYCDNMVQNGTSENFNPLTGEAQFDRAYTWSTSAFLILASYLESGEF